MFLCCCLSFHPPPGLCLSCLFFFLRPCLIHARMSDCGRAFLHGHTFLHSWSYLPVQSYSCSLRAFYYASPSSGEAYRDRRLTTNFELWVEIFCVPTCFHMRFPKPCLSVCPHPEKRNPLSFVNISPTLVIDTSMERSSRVLNHGNTKIWFFFFKKVRNSNFDFWQRTEITLASSILVLH